MGLLAHLSDIFVGVTLLALGISIGFMYGGSSFCVCRLFRFLTFTRLKRWLKKRGEDDDAPVDPFKAFEAQKKQKPTPPPNSVYADT